MTLFLHIVKALCLVLAALALVAAAYALFFALPSWIFFSAAVFIGICALIAMVFVVIDEANEGWDDEDHP